MGDMTPEMVGETVRTVVLIPLMMRLMIDRRASEVGVARTYWWTLPHVGLGWRMEGGSIPQWTFPLMVEQRRRQSPRRVQGEVDW